MTEAAGRGTTAAGTNTVVLLAGGVGSRVGLDIPKQLVRVAGAPILEHTIRVFQAHPEVDAILVLMARGHLDAVRAIVADGGYTKVTQVLEGAATRSQTSMRALAAIPHADGKVLLHDAVRPFVSARIVSDCVRALDDYAAVDVAIPSADTIIEVTPENTIAAVPRRSALRRVQTPQGFRLSTIREAYARAAADPGFEATDDCSVVLRYLPDVPILVVPGDERNLKVTDPIDVHLADTLLRLAHGASAPSALSAPAVREETG
jgi:ribitol-5-phosphate 2-dehydrogenase (NADP+) / D-ribitol-5-phosphate cytidylyltransferase